MREFISELRGVSDTAKWANIFDKIGLARTPLENLCADGNFDAARNRIIVTLRSEHFLPRQALPASARDRSADAVITSDVEQFFTSLRNQAVKSGS